MGIKGGALGHSDAVGAGWMHQKTRGKRKISRGSVGSQQRHSAARNRGSSLPSHTPKSCSTPTGRCRIPTPPLSAKEKTKKKMHISYKWPNSQAKKKKKNHHWNQKSSSSTFIAAIQRFNNATKGLLTLKGEGWGGEMFGFSRNIKPLPLAQHCCICTGQKGANSLRD